MLHSNVSCGNVRFNAIGRDGRLRDHIRSAFLDSTLMYFDTPFPEITFKRITFKRITYQVHYERCDHALFPKQLVKAIISFQHWKDGTNHAIIRPWAPRPVAGKE